MIQHAGLGAEQVAQLRVGSEGAGEGGGQGGAASHGRRRRLHRHAPRRQAGESGAGSPAIPQPVVETEASLDARHIGRMLWLTRTGLIAQQGALPVNLGPLSHAEAHDLLVGRPGSARVAASRRPPSRSSRHRPACPWPCRSRRPAWRSAQAWRSPTSSFRALIGPRGRTVLAAREGRREAASRIARVDAVDAALGDPRPDRGQIG